MLGGDSLGPEREARLRERLRPVRWIKEVPIGGPETRGPALEAAERYASCADLLLLDTHANREWIGATGLVHDWSISAEIVRSAPIPCILAGGLDAGNLRGALETVAPWGVDSYSRTNLPSLRKDLDKVRAFVEVAPPTANRSTSCSATCSATSDSIARWSIGSFPAAFSLLPFVARSVSDPRSSPTVVDGPVQAN